jgi:hypothetical protein
MFFRLQLAGEEVRGEQADPETLPVLPLPEMPGRRHEAELGSILRNSVSAENFSDKFLSSNFGQIFTQ